MSKPLIECVPNFSEGRDPAIIEQIAAAIRETEGVTLLDVDPGKATNRTVMTFVGAPEPVVEAAFRAIRTAAMLIDMSRHTGEHPRMGATDVCPLIPISGISMDETAAWAHRLAEKVGSILDIPVFMYEGAATCSERQNLATIRAGEYEGLAAKLKDPVWAPDYGKAVFNPRSGATVIGARDFLVAYNINLNTTSVRRANSVAFDVREQGRVLREGDSVAGKVLTNEQGEPLRKPGWCKSVKGIGWYIEEYGIAQVSMNLTNIRETPLHIAFEACCRSARERGMRVTGSELVGLVPKQVLIDAGKYFLRQQQRSVGIADEDIIHIAVKTMGLEELRPFDPRKKVIEYCIADANPAVLAAMTLRKFAATTASESPAPGGGSISAYVGALGAALGGMVANLSAHKRGWDDQWAYFSDWAEKAQALQEKLITLVDEDTNAFNSIMEAFALPKNSDEEKKVRSAAIQQATKKAIEIPLEVMRTASACLSIIKVMVTEGNPNSISDAGVGALCIRAAVMGAWMNVRINASGYKDKAWLENVLSEANTIVEEVKREEIHIVAQVLESVDAA